MKSFQKQTHKTQQITIETDLLLDALCRESKLSRPMQLEKLVEQAFKKLEKAKKPEDWQLEDLTHARTTR